ncbi:nucleotidyl transferase AbiEii/AbiGii toxin family protein [Slackia exigua]|uniref:nucleotidyl transferase AbiEii/AbiGii toxin family protein n=1 Tax=Slackia exigua TaxID=84109 RepID=UPI0028D2E7ED|nr:nucleotidyl transferase AbiEii/AbiGii toxin family protein [Slackia exigua]
MIKGERRVKDLIKNVAKGDSGKAQRLQRHYAMERFLERVSISDYRDKMILKGGMLVSSIVGLDARSTMDIDTTCKDMPLDLESASRMVEEITLISLDDDMSFDVGAAQEIMEDSEYGGVRIPLVAHLGKSRIPLKIDVSTGDAITPSEVDYEYSLMFEDRSIHIWTYSIETLLAEKLETVLSRSVSNTRPRDFYDIFALTDMGYPEDRALFAEAFENTCSKRGTVIDTADARNTLALVRNSRPMENRWIRFGKDFDYASEIEWKKALNATLLLFELTV